ncbi:MAG: XdhC/CoxI family protein [Thermoanaerobaculia bacterium]|nr:XdhC/CoxI family protein [Thermoanaerobaculia bacterium]
MTTEDPERTDDDSAKPSPSPVAVLPEAEKAVRSQGRAALCQIVRCEGSTPGKLGWKLLVRPDGTRFGNLGGGAFEAMVEADAREMLADSGSSSRVKRYYLTEEAVQGDATGMVCGGMIEVFLERLIAAPLVVICGGGPVGQGVARAAKLAGFDRLVADDREAFRDPRLFPSGTELAEVDREYGSDFLGPFAERELHVTIVSRCWETDAAALASVIRQAPPGLRYVGLMGSRRKIERVRREVEDRGYELADLPLHAPIGLPIGGDSPGEIAISVLAEIVQLRTRRESSRETRLQAVQES